MVVERRYLITKARRRGPGGCEKLPGLNEAQHTRAIHNHGGDMELTGKHISPRLNGKLRRGRRHEKNTTYVNRANTSSQSFPLLPCRGRSRMPPAKAIPGPHRSLSQLADHPGSWHIGRYIRAYAVVWYPDLASCNLTDRVRLSGAGRGPLNTTGPRNPEDSRPQLILLLLPQVRDRCPEAGRRPLHCHGACTKRRKAGR